ncbi:uncharacterized protein LOC110100784 [Dendrobium catenatum]|uniref:Mal d 1-associated protein n=1 Tax=Dendrobium catenatum TaxID=906689 RepID=A0A2I0VAI8_9ASPA|nr:uncharacterized protein LOC110100784 [Dendrobium catenatum]PKU60422.1 hypothetical protein MA16_Dca026130 [Dendrobium catenatum]
MAWWKKASTGFGGEGDGSAEERSCSNRRIVKSSCRTEEVEPGRFVRKCEKTEQLLRQCAGRPAEVVESKTEHTEDDISNDVKQGFLPPFESNGSEPFSFPGLRNDLESIEREFIGGFSTFMEATEKVANEFFNSFGVPSIQSSRPPLDHRRTPAHWQHESRSSKEMKDHYGDLDVEIREV